MALGEWLGLAAEVARGWFEELGRVTFEIGVRAATTNPVANSPLMLAVTSLLIPALFAVVIFVRSNRKAREAVELKEGFYHQLLELRDLRHDLPAVSPELVAKIIGQIPDKERGSEQLILSELGKTVDERTANSRIPGHLKPLRLTAYI